MFRTVLAILLTLLAVGQVPLGIAPVSSPPSFTQVVAAPALGQMGEPSIFVDGATPAHVWTTAPGFGVWGSTDGGASFGKFVNGPFDSPSGVETSGDASLAQDADGVLYLAGLDVQDPAPRTVLPVQVSSDGGHSWALTQLLPGSSGLDCDRQWMGARGHGEAIYTANCATEVVYRTTNGGASWTGPISVANDLCIPGPVANAANGDWLFLYDDCGSVILMRSADGISWTRTIVGARSGGIHFPVVASDAAGTLYAAWDNCVGIQNSECRVYATHSADGGAHWTTPQAVSPTGVIAIYPWIVAGAAGKVDLAYYQESVTEPVRIADLAPPTMKWDVMLAQSLNANATTPSWTRVVAAAGFHQGSICTTGLACVGPQNLGVLNAPTPFDRRVYDFFEVRADAQGNALIAYPRDVPTPVGGNVGTMVDETVFTFSDLVVARQTGGTTIQ